MAQNIQISTTYNMNSESIQLDDLSLPNEPNVNKTTIIGSSTPQRIASDTFTSPNPPLNNENKILKSIRSSKIPTIKKSLVMTTKTETTNGLNLRSLIGPIRKSILPVAKPTLKSVISMAKQTTASPRVALKSIGNMASPLRPIQSKKFYSTSTPRPAPANRTRLKVSCENEANKKTRCSLSNIDITRIHPDGEDGSVDTIIHKNSVIKN